MKKVFMMSAGSALLFSVAAAYGMYNNYASYRAPVAETFALLSVEPKVFSPDEDDTSISRVRFSVENPNFSEVSSSIFDMQGRIIRTNLSFETVAETVLYWDGKDNDGSTVPSGVYIYQIESDGKIVNGTVVVAR